ncbi:phage minor capsid protein [Nonomuraea rhizosphaerae]|uniref:phage minor capsid protein n=1 Tax=Nonomuraea rhizosphaerae TaxID=2665663 RepID=UPI001C5FFB75|nr:phage minor capsid protein [Nonomuraea rhizosphaerae]
MADLLEQVEERIALAAAISTRYAEAEEHLFEVVAKAVAKSGSAPQQASARLAEVKALGLQAEKVLKELESFAAQALEEGVTKAWQDGFVRASQELERLGEDKGISPGKGLAQLLKEALGLLPALTTGALRQVNDIYRQVIAETTPLALTGAVTREQATTRALQKFAAKGITFFDGKNRTWSISSYAEMAARTAMARAANEGHLQTLRENGRDLVMVSRAPYTCPLCDPWEGKVLTQAGAAGDRQEKNVLTGEIIAVHVAGTVAQARAAGLQHPNCKHTFGVYLPGLTKPAPKPAAKGTYEDTQQQRYLERQIRAWKRRAAAAPPGSAEKKAAEQHTKAFQAQMKEHLDKTGLLRQRNRERVRPDETTTPDLHPSSKPPPAAPSSAKPKSANSTPLMRAKAHATTRPTASGRKSSMRDAVRHRTNADGEQWINTKMAPIPRSRWDNDELRAIEAYTGSAYTSMNSALRGPPRSGRPETRKLIDDLDKAMTRQSVPEPVIVHRGVDDGFTKANGVDLGSDEEMEGMVGRVLRDKAYMSTSVGRQAAFHLNDIALAVRVPAGHPALNVEGLTSNPGERELLLRRGTTYVVHSVYKVNSQWYVEAEIVPDDWFDTGPPADWRPDPLGDIDTGYSY